MDKIIIFKLWGDYAHFKKFYTTTSPLTFEFPPPPTLFGIISAIIGLDKTEYLDHFQNPDDFKLAVRIVNPIKKVRWSENLINTKDYKFQLVKSSGHAPHSPTRIEFLKDPAYLVYFGHNDPLIYETLKINLQKHQSVYSVCLGLSELLANFEYVGETEVKPMSSSGEINLITVLPESYLVDDISISFEGNREIFKVNYPILMQSDRVVNRREDILFERNGKPIGCKLKQYWESEQGESIVFF
ncbi:MAG: type I-B CRISPR-associated protein Cas5b [Candidatus Neomarinimicrobiota bacterium]|jgi:CRISPR-associated protein Cas5h|nr:type I-B CRISPR-associated protein Cas5b [Candidatus Neomarinimicrobiota bacterium]